MIENQIKNKQFQQKSKRTKFSKNKEINKYPNALLMLNKLRFDDDDEDDRGADYSTSIPIRFKSQPQLIARPKKRLTSHEKVLAPEQRTRNLPKWRVTFLKTENN